MQDHIDVGDIRLAVHVARPIGVTATTRRLPGLVLTHGFPVGPRGATAAGQTYPQFADRLAAEVGWVVLTFNFRGTGGSTGDFSLDGWCGDIRAAIDHLLDVEQVGGVWLAGSSTGGALSLCVAASDERVRGVATLAAPADFGDWAVDPKSLLAHSRQIGAITTPGFPPDQQAWARALRECRPLRAMAQLAPRPSLLLHGDEDDVVPVSDARALADAGRGYAELRIVHGAGHRLRHDPRAVALLIGWLARQEVA